MNSTCCITVLLIILTINVSYVYLITVALPVITRHPNYNGPIIVAEGSNVVLRCEATGNGTLNYQWRRVSGSLPSNARRSNGRKFLTINNIGVSDNGQYYCEVDNGGERVRSSRVTVTAKSKIIIKLLNNDHG